MRRIAPSIGCCDLLHLEQQIKTLEADSIRWLHMDVMDGSFVPNFCLGTDFIAAVRGITQKQIYTHMMAVSPEKHISLVKRCGSDYLAFHIETTTAPFRLIRQIHDEGMKAGIAINPATSLDRLEDLLEVADAITLMSIEPGIIGPKFMEMSYARIRKMREMIEISGREIELEIDGGINFQNARMCLDLGASVLVAGIHAIFKEEGAALEHHLEEFQSLIS